MRKIVDSNCLQSDELDHYLSSDRSNYAVITDYAAMEAYKGDTLKSIFKSMSVLREHPQQVIVLKDTRQVCGLSGRKCGLQKRLIDKGQTRHFNVFCKDLLLAQGGNISLQKQILSLGQDANKHMERVLADSEYVRQAITLMTKVYTKDELTIFRRKDDITAEMTEKIMKNILFIAGKIFKDHPSTTTFPAHDELLNTFIFRYSLAGYLLSLDWLSNGGVDRARQSRLRNDIVDMGYVAYATFFDGLLSNDKKACNLYQQASFILDCLGRR